MTTANNNSSGTSSPGEDIGDDLMQEVAANLGQKLPTIKPAAEAGGEGTGEGEETAEEKTAREKAEAEAAGGGEGGGEVEETEEEKLAREKAEAETEETDEEKALREQAEADEAAQNPGAADKTAAAKELETALKDATPEARKAAQAVIDGIIDKVVVKERAEKSRLGARVTELTTELETAKKATGPTIVGSVNPAFMADDVGDIDAREEQIEKFERWATRAIRDGGVNLPDSEGYDDKKPSYTVEQIEARLDDVTQEKKKILPAARANLQRRAQIDTNLRKIYPAVYDPTTAEYAQVQQVLKALPELKQFADYRVIALKQILGDRALADLIDKQKKEKTPTGQTKKIATTLPKKTPPRAPGGGGPAKGGVLDPKSSKTAAAPAMKKVMSNPGDKAAFRGAVEALISDI